MNMAKTKFKVELEIEVEYDGVPEGIASTPYTRASGYTDNGNLVLVTDCGKIVDFNLTKLERKPE